MSKYKVHITAAELLEGKSQRTGNDYKMVQIQGILENGNDRQIFRTALPRGFEVPAVGQHFLSFEPSVDFRSMELNGRITALEPVSKG